jgi:hypothetical protein
MRRCRGKLARRVDSESGFVDCVGMNPLVHERALISTVACTTTATLLELSTSYCMKDFLPFFKLQAASHRGPSTADSSQQEPVILSWTRANARLTLSLQALSGCQGDLFLSSIVRGPEASREREGTGTATSRRRKMPERVQRTASRGSNVVV